jgi:hypothetical protein
MTTEEANKLLDALKDGQQTRPSDINEALYTTGDLQRRTPTFDLDGWNERRKTVRLAKSKTT